MKENQIGKLLEERGETIQRLADSMGKTYPGIHRLVRKKDISKVTLETLTLVAEFLNVSVEDLYIKKND